MVTSIINRHKPVNKDMVSIHSSTRTFLNKNSIPEISLKWELKNVHLLIKTFSSNKVPNILIAGRLKHFLKTWKKLTRDQSTLDLVDGYIILSQRKPLQSNIYSNGNKPRTTKTDEQGSEGNVE